MKYIIPRLILTLIYWIAVYIGVAMAVIAGYCAGANRYLRRKG